MVTYLEKDRILFSGDFFGSHLALTNIVSSDDFGVMEAVQRYYAEIMISFGHII
jgi:flavorubredoxin